MNLKSVLSFFGFWEYSKCYRFLKSVLSFSKPQRIFKKIKMSRILLSITVNLGCSSNTYLSTSIDYNASNYHLDFCTMKFWLIPNKNPDFFSHVSGSSECSCPQQSKRYSAILQYMRHRTWRWTSAQGQLVTHGKKNDPSHLGDWAFL